MLTIRNVVGDHEYLSILLRIDPELRMMDDGRSELSSQSVRISWSSRCGKMSLGFDDSYQVRLSIQSMLAGRDGFKQVEMRMEIKGDLNQWMGRLDSNMESLAVVRFEDEKVYSGLRSVTSSSYYHLNLLVSSIGFPSTYFFPPILLPLVIPVSSPWAFDFEIRARSQVDDAISSSQSR